MDGNFEELKEILVHWAKRAYNARMVPATSGNISIKTGGVILISKSGVCLGDMDTKDVAEINFNGESLNGVKPSSENKMHIEIYKRRPDLSAIIHIHCPYVTAFAVCNKEINEPILPEFIFNFEKIPSAKYALPSSFELADEIAGHFENGHNSVLMQNHGLVAGGTSLKQTFYALESIQAYTKTYFAAKFLGDIKRIPENEIEKIKQLKG